ncbi:oligoribonuclease [Jonesia quinghaiensis]|uniref:oligoribonuclease n=1 Tax=Jonesia quinghaiensis TaxID=262806 RepID=UPI0003FD7261|nr:oligoribonuclease [Jonesia quinghaiensis]
MTTSAQNQRIVWIDCEMTGLDIENDALIEIAVVVTDSELNPLDAGIDVVIRPPAEALTSMGDFVRQMHTSSGLITELDAGITLAEAEEQVLAYVKRHTTTARKAPLAGNSVGTDRLFLARDMPRLTEHLHYRIIDVSSLKELARRWYPRTYYAAPGKNGGHRALADILESIDELRYYRATMFVPAPGLDTKAARTVATQISKTAVADAHTTTSTDGGVDHLD